MSAAQSYRYTPEAPRSREELEHAAMSLPANGILVITDAEFTLIRKEVGLAYRWQGRRIHVA